MKLATVFGSSSFEHEISIVSAISLKEVLTKVDLIYIFIDKNREFYLIDTKEIKSSLFSSGEYKKSPKLELKQGGFYQKKLFGDSKVDIDTVLNLVHGCDGEDGKLASLFEFYNINYIGPRLEASSMSYNKLYTKLYARSLGVNIVDYQVLNINDKRDLDFEFPIIVKPLRLGSSIGVSIVKKSSELDYALDVAFEFDSDILIEPFLEDLREFNLAGYMADKFIFSKVEEPTKTKEFLDFDKKYLDFARVKADLGEIDENLTFDLKTEFAKIYNNTFNGSLIRCDFFYYENRIYLNEINPIPGSMANYLFDDFEENLLNLIKHLPTSKEVEIDYKYINSIQNAKGK